MAIINKKAISIDVDVKFHVETDTAYQALNIIDIWLAENPGRKIEIEQFEDGTWCNNLISAPEETAAAKATAENNIDIDSFATKLSHRAEGLLSELNAKAKH